MLAPLCTVERTITTRKKTGTVSIAAPNHGDIVPGLVETRVIQNKQCKYCSYLQEFLPPPHTIAVNSPSTKKRYYRTCSRSYRGRGTSCLQQILLSL